MSARIPLPVLILAWLLFGCGSSLTPAESAKLSAATLACTDHQIQTAHKVKLAGGHCVQAREAIAAMLPLDADCVTAGIVDANYICAPRDGGSDGN